MKVIDGVLKEVKEEDLKNLEENPDGFWNGVTAIGSFAFRGLKNLKSIIIPEGITEIYSFVFEKCYNLETVFLPSTLTSIGVVAFSDCTSIKSITIPANVNFIGDWAFRGCESLVRVTLKNVSPLSEMLEDILKYFNFDSFKVNGDKVIFIRNIENNKDNENN